MVLLNTCLSAWLFSTLASPGWTDWLAAGFFSTLGSLHGCYQHLLLSSAWLFSTLASLHGSFSTLACLHGCSQHLLFCMDTVFVSCSTQLLKEQVARVHKLLRPSKVPATIRTRPPPPSFPSLIDRLWSLCTLSPNKQLVLPALRTSYHIRIQVFFTNLYGIV